MDVKFYSTTWAKLNSLPIVNGQLIYLEDKEASYYDMGNQRHAISGVKIVSTLPDSNQQANILYVVINNDGTATGSIWDSTDSSFKTVTPSGATTAQPGAMSVTDKVKLDSISDGAEVNQNAFSNIVVGSTTIEADSKTGTVTFVGGLNVTVSGDDQGNAVTISARDTTYSGATTAVDGLLTATDKVKLNGIETGAEVNQNAFSNIAVGSTYVVADSKTSTLNLEAGNNITLTPDPTQGKVIVSAAPSSTYDVVSKSAPGLAPQLPNETTTTKYLRQDGTWVAPPDTTYPVATKSAPGLAPQLPDESTTTKFLRQDGTWNVPPGTTYAVVTTSKAGLVTARPSSNPTLKFFRGDATWAQPTAASVTYDHTASGTTWTTGQQAIDGLHSLISDLQTRMTAVESVGAKALTIED